MSEIVIGIHGMGNKPPPKTLKRWWYASMREGLKRIQKADLRFDFELVYWAHYLHPAPLKPRIKDKDHPLFIDDPYLPALPDAAAEKPSKLRQKLADYVSAQLDDIFLNEDLSINYESIVDFIIHHFFKDLERYYHDHCVISSEKNAAAKEKICSELVKTLKKHRRKKIMLISHSLGSIIAYDVLTHSAADLPVDTLVTIGSPLGLPIIKSRIFAERRQDSVATDTLKTPDNIRRHWYNLADLRDKIAINYKLQDDFAANAAGIRPLDKVVVNDYVYGDEKNPHKSFGYLRTPEIAAIIDSFLGDADQPS